MFVIQSASNPSANEMAFAASFNFRVVKCEMRSPILPFGTVWRLSKFAAHMSGKPSSSVNTTSVGMLRIVDVIGATVTAFNTGIAESRVRIKTGRFLSGVLNVYQQISPLFTRRPSPVRYSTRQIRQARQVCAHSPQRAGLLLPGPGAAESRLRARHG